MANLALSRTLGWALSTRLPEAASSFCSAQTRHQNKDPYAQPSEPILFAKLRIYFADFPYLLCSIDQRRLLHDCTHSFEKPMSELSRDMHNCRGKALSKAVTLIRAAANDLRAVLAQVGSSVRVGNFKKDRMQ